MHPKVPTCLRGKQFPRLESASCPPPPCAGHSAFSSFASKEAAVLVAAAVPSAVTTSASDGPSVDASGMLAAV